MTVDGFFVDDCRWFPAAFVLAAVHIIRNQQQQVNSLSKTGVLHSCPKSFTTSPHIVIFIWNVTGLSKLEWRQPREIWSVSEVLLWAGNGHHNLQRSLQTSTYTAAFQWDTGNCTASEATAGFLSLQKFCKIQRILVYFLLDDSVQLTCKIVSISTLMKLDFIKQKTLAEMFRDRNCNL